LVETLAADHGHGWGFGFVEAQGPETEEEAERRQVSLDGGFGQGVHVLAGDSDDPAAAGLVSGKLGSVDEEDRSSTFGGHSRGSRAGWACAHDYDVPEAGRLGGLHEEGA
jgi:hypothetical protein